MLKKGKETASPSEKEDSRESSGTGWFGSHWGAVSVCVIVLIALLLRTVFAYGISAGSDFALSGGTGAQYHLHVIESILNGSYAIGADSAVNYPVGGLNVNPPLVDFIAAGIASFTSPSAALGGLNPVLGALTCIPVYLIGKEMFGSKTIGVVAALIFAFLPLPISSSVFSNGTEYALAAFLAAFMSLFLVKAAKALDEEDGRKSAIVNGVIAGVLLGLCALTWNGFGVLFAVVAAALLLQIVVRRIGEKDMRQPFLVYAIVMVIGIAMAAAYYIPAGLWDAVFSGPCLLTVLTLVFAAAFVALGGKSWVITIPSLVIAFVAVLVVMYFAVPDLFSALVAGNIPYVGEMKELVSSRVSMSNVASYYGWLTMWLPLCLAFYETYVFIRKDRSSLRLFTAVWLYMMFFAVWSSYGTAAAVGCVFGVGSAAALVKLVKYAKVREWFSEIRSSGLSKGLRKLIKPLPFATVLIVALLVVTPNLVYGLDAGVPTNDSSNVLYNGNTQYFIKTGDDYPIGKILESQEGVEKSGALASWIDYTYDTVNGAGFKSVTDSTGNGTAAVSHMLLSDGSAGAISSMIMRIMLAHDINEFESDFTDAKVYNQIKTYHDDCDALYNEIRTNAAEYGKIKSDISRENALYLASVKEMTDNMSVVDLSKTYDSICARAGQKISYVLLDPAMLPLQYNGGDHFSTLAYFADYSSDSYGAAPEFYSYNPYYGYTNYTDSMYDSFLWKAYIGPSAEEAGISSTYSYLYSLSMSDGTVAASPEGMAGFQMSKWIVRYSAEKDPKSDDWTYLNYADAVNLQKKEGGVINYLSSYILYEYVGSSATSLSGALRTEAGVPADYVDGMVAELYVHNSVAGKQVLVSSDVVRDGKYSLSLPSDAQGYTVVLKSGDVEVASFKDHVPAVYTLPAVSVDGTFAIDGQPVAGKDVKLVFQNASASKAKYEVNTSDGTFAMNRVVEGQYAMTAYDSSGAKISTSDVVIVSGDGKTVSGLSIAPTTKKLTATVKDINGQPVGSGRVVATDTSTGLQYSAPVEDGTAVINLMAGTYTLQMVDGYTVMNTSTYTISNSDRSASLTAYPAFDVDLSGLGALVFSSGDFSTVSYDGKVSLPRSLATDLLHYTISGVNGDKIVLGFYNGSLVLNEYAPVKVKGVLKNGDSAVSGNVYLVNSIGQTVTAVAKSDGSFAMAVPAGSYQMFADNGSMKVYAGILQVDSDKDLGDIPLVDGRRVTVTLRYTSGTSSGSVGLPYVAAKINYTYEGVDYTMYSMTNTSGQVIFRLPVSIDSKVVFNGGLLDNEYFRGTDLESTVHGSTSSSATYVTFSQFASPLPKNYVKQVSVTSEYAATLTPYSSGDDITFAAGETKTINSGQYTAKVDSSGWYFNDTVYAYPGQSVFTGLEPMKAHAVKVTKNDGDVISVNTSDDDATFFESDGTYYFKDGYVYYLKSVSSTDSDVRFATVDLTSEYSVSTIDMAANVAPMTVTGTIGAAANGDLLVSSGGVSIFASIENGQYSVKLPSTMTSAQFKVDAKETVSDMEYVYSASKTVSGLRDGSVVNIAVTGEGSEVEDEDAKFSAAVDYANFSAGKARVDVSINNKSDYATTYVISSGKAWSLDKAVSVLVAPGETKTVTVEGVYDDQVYAVGSEGISVVVTDISGAGSKTIQIKENSAPKVGSKGVIIVSAGERSGEVEGSLDKISATEYMYAVTVSNLDNYSKEVKFTVPSVSGWSVTISDEDGYVIRDSGSSFTIYGLETKVFYVKYMVDGDGTGLVVPSANVTVECDGTTKVLSISPADVKVTVDSMEADGDDVFNSRSGMPVGVWFLLAVGILLLIAVFWLGSKRGVFSRK
jgi:hypothetical protein